MSAIKAHRRRMWTFHAMAKLRRQKLEQEAV